VPPFASLWLSKFGVKSFYFMRDPFEGGPGAQRPEVIELIRTMSRRKLTARETKRLDQILPLNRPDPKEAFIIKPAGDWLRTETDKPDAEMLFGEFWHDGELCILFADTNVGKSILAVQIGDALSKGKPIDGFTMPHQPEKVLYFDFELSTRQFDARYSSNVYGRYPFSADFYRLVLNPESTGQRRFTTFADHIHNGIGNAIVSTGAKIVIIDNITCLQTGTESAAMAIKLMGKLRDLKNEYGLSFLVLAHTPKRNSARPLTRNDLQGSKMLINFADSAFAIGESQSRGGLRYLKQIKQRSTSETYGAQNVCLCRIAKPQNLLHLEFCGHSAEHLHLAAHTQQVQRQQEEHVLNLHQQGQSLRQIAQQAGMSYSAVHRLVRRVGLEGVVKSEG
jgi:KaiC/GvpD/RAD55 family RecA-like ATPase